LRRTGPDSLNFEIRVIRRLPHLARRDYTPGSRSPANIKDTQSHRHRVLNRFLKLALLRFVATRSGALARNIQPRNLQIFFVGSASADAIVRKQSIPLAQDSVR